MTLPTDGRRDAQILVVCDAPTPELWEAGRPIAGGQLRQFSEYAQKFGFGREDFAFISPCPPMPPECEGSDKRESQYLEQHRQGFLETLQFFTPRVVMYLGKLAGKQLTGKPVKITKVRGVIRKIDSISTPVMPMLSPGHILRRPELREIFESDFNMLRIAADAGWSISASSDAVTEVNYEWRYDISDILAKPPKVMSFDTEFEGGLDWYKPEVQPLTFQMSFQPGHAIVSPMSSSYCERHGMEPLTPRNRVKLIRQWRTLLENPAIKKTGHNIKIDHHIAREKTGIYIRGWAGDTQLLTFCVDENMQEKSQDECVRRWVPEMAGYADRFNQTFDKEHMELVPPEDMLQYGGGDADSNLRLAQRLFELVRKDKRQWQTYRKVILPTIRTFTDVLEPHGIRIDTQALADLQKVLDETASAEYKELIAEVPVEIRRKHADAGLEFSRPSFVSDILFTKEGLNLKPKVFTPGTRKLKPADQIPSTSTKEHLPFFDDIPFVARLIKYQKLDKLRNTYVGRPYDSRAKGPTGFWQYIYEGRIHPSFMLHRTVTGRSSSSNPNAQNFPKRGDLAKAFRKIFIPTEGYVFAEADLSQAELRIAAWMAGDPVMLKIYREDGDIHTMTAAAVMGISVEQFKALDKDTQKQKRFQAKAVNFGFLYGMGWRKFLAYAKTDYGITFTEAEAQRIRTTFFKTYRALEPWHLSMRQFVQQHGYVRALHGAFRHLPNIRSSDDGIRSECERQAINSPVQRFASDLGLTAMVRLARDADPDLIRPVAFIHDALVVEIKIGHEQEMMSALRYYMETPPLKAWFGLTSPIPIKSDVSLGMNLGEMEEMGDAVQPIRPDWHQEEYDLAA